VLLNTAPLLEEERYVGITALGVDALNPLAFHRASTRTRLTANDYPVNVAKWEQIDWAEEWLNGKEPDCGWYLSKQGGSVGVLLILHTDAHPDVFGPVKRAAQLHESFGAFREYLELVLRARRHRFEHTLDEAERHIRMEEVRHGIHENQAWLPPLLREFNEIIVEG